MARIYKCDRCGHAYERPITPDLSVIRYQHNYGDMKYDLCDKCLEDLEKFLKGYNLFEKGRRLNQGGY